MTKGEQPIAQITNEKCVINAGLTKRELFAAMAMQGLLSAGYNSIIQNYTDAAYEGVMAADRLIEALNTAELNK